MGDEMKTLDPQKLNHATRSDYRMVAAGREDENVRMLGNGRPFYFELINPRSPRQVQELYPVLQAEINSGPHSDAVKVRHLLKVESINLKAIKAAEETKNKTYCALVWVHKEVTEEMLNTWKDLVNDKFTLQQKTPVCQLQRWASNGCLVALSFIHVFTVKSILPLFHRIRRVQAIRFKCIYSLAVKPAFDMKDETLDPRKRHFVTVHIHAQAGTYIKEFVHGDLGRTKPSLCDILKENVQMVALDMIDIDIVWPPARKVDIWYGNDNRKTAQMARV
ncbi:hypothetical protein BC938DRAFT_484065 [Jimgerdemannia flammicorona]|uniref:tRNA pseudouridine(55) synthase n=1 Tax=Jimgerdemannia flammicorona TaxID=994334 RepID=A0A433QAK6_9FUNG|nr:hypothetical protein BC938DRAFT_484065 [Jimgerdemannia flammicorona]